jgi:predicted choloylglycine hydrolase
MLHTCSSVDEAVSFLNNHPHGSSMNLILADKHKAVSIELSGKNNTFSTVSTL